MSIISDPKLREAAEAAMKIQPDPNVTRLQKAMRAVEDVLDERGKTHGEYREHAGFTQAIKLVLQSSPNWRTMSASQRETLDMIAHKVGRILAGDPNYKDHWTDIAGYAVLVEKQL